MFALSYVLDILKEELLDVCGIELCFIYLIFTQ
jgi:hypothetical protein